MIRLALRVGREHAELVLAELLELLPDGVEERELDERTVEFAAYGAPGELPALPQLQAAAGGALVDISTSEVAEDWSERWRDFHRPVLIAAPRAAPGARPAALRVRPPWEPSLARRHGRELEEIEIDPGQAFGTGAHATTRLCLELLLGLAAHDPGRGGLLDVGTGSGVIAIAAARLGYAPVLALDNDPESVRAAAANATANAVQLEVRRLDLRREPLPAAPTLCANLLRPLLLALAQAIAEPPRALIAGGLLSGEGQEIAQAFERALGLRLLERREQAGWEALLLAR